MIFKVGVCRQLSASLIYLVNNVSQTGEIGVIVIPY